MTRTLVRRSEDRRTVFVVLFSLGVSMGLVLARPSSWILQTASCVVMSQLFFVCAVIGHNSMHRPVFRAPWLNRTFQVLITLSTGETASSFVPVHNFGHHTHLQTEKDMMRTSKARFRWNFLNQLLFTYLVGGAVTRSTYRYFWAMRRRRPSWFHQVVLEALVLWSSWLVLLWFDWSAFLLYVFIPQQFAGWGIVGINFVQHDGCDPEHPYNHSRNFTGKLVNWWTFNNGFHGIHHMKPGAHWADLKRLNDALLAPHCHPALQQPSLLAHLVHAFLWPGKRLRYDGKPVEVGELKADEPWIPQRRDAKTAVSYGAAR